MSCELANSLLHSYFDNQLNPPRAAEFERHLLNCTECAALLVDLDLLSSRLQVARLYTLAPNSLRAKIRAGLSPVAGTSARSRPLLWHWLAAAAALFLFAVIGWRVNSNLRTDDYQDGFAEEIVEAHMASLHPGNMTGIASSDAHVVNEWFSEKAKFSVTVHDFSHEGFILQGGRMDLVEGRTIPALVYRHDGHLINVFMWPSRERDTAPREGSRQGFRWVDWRKRKMEFCAVSDIDPTDLKKLYKLMDWSTGQA